MTSENQEFLSDEVHTYNTTFLEKVISYITSTYDFLYPKQTCLNKEVNQQESHPQKVQLNKLYDQHVNYLPYKSYSTSVIGDFTIRGNGLSINSNTFSNNAIKQNHVTVHGTFSMRLNGEMNRVHFDPFKSEVKENKACIIENFNPSKDKILLSSVSSLQEIIIKQTKMDGDDYTCLEIKNSVLCLSGDIDLTTDNIMV